MGIKSRYLRENVIGDLEKKMVFVGGPRQVGKTIFAQKIIGPIFKSKYFNWDKISNRQTVLKGEWPTGFDLMILDEFHKHSKWKRWIKGEFDVHKEKLKFLLTGSARLNVYRRGGDSLQGRYHYYRLHPFSLAETTQILPKITPNQELPIPEGFSTTDLDALFEYGGFPEPLISQDKRTLRRWHIERLERFFKEDIRDLTLIQDLGNLSLLAELLPERTSSILSINSLARDLGVNFRTVAKWLTTFEQFYYCFRVPPYQSKKFASVKKEQKLYLWDWSQINDPGAKIENLVGSHLLKLCHYLQDCEGYKTELFFLRDD
ncbi:MAG: AAA family ATPase, partial [Pseudomonadota bacterium]